MKRKLKAILTVFLMVLLSMSFNYVKANAAEDPWTSYKRILLSYTPDIEYGKEFFDLRSSGLYHNLTSASYAKFYFYGTKLRIRDDLDPNRKSGALIYIDNNPAESISSYRTSFTKNGVSYSKSGLANKLHSVYISIPYEYNKYFAMFYIDLDEDGYLTKDANHKEYYDGLSISAETDSTTINKNDEFDVNLKMKNISSFASTDITFNYDPAKFKLEGYSQNKDIKVEKFNNNNGTIRMVLKNLGNQDIITKISPIKLKFKAVGSGSSVMDIRQADISNSVNKIISLPDAKCGRLFMNIN